jgi:hypothetical protein
MARLTEFHHQQAHCQVSESYDGLDPPVGDGREPGQWGPRGTHVSQAPSDV